MGLRLTAGVEHGTVRDKALGFCLGVAVGWRAGNRREPVRYMGCPLAGTAGARGCSSMVEPQPSKLVMRVRFPSSALADQITFYALAQD